MLTVTKCSALLHNCRAWSFCLRPSWTQGHNNTDILSSGSSAGHSWRQRGNSSPLSSPGEVSSRQPWVPVQLLPLSGGGQRVRDKALCDSELSAWVWLCLLGGTLKIVCVCVCAYEKYLCWALLPAHLCFSRFYLHLLCVNTVPLFSWNADTSNLTMSL